MHLKDQTSQNKHTCTYYIKAWNLPFKGMSTFLESFLLRNREYAKTAEEKRTVWEAEIVRQKSILTFTQ